MNEVNNLIDNVFNTQTLLNQENITNIIKTIVKENDLEDYVKNILFLSDDSFSNLAAYFPTTKELRFYLNNINYYFYMWCRENGLYLTDIKAKRYYNINILNIVFHELEHVKQTKQADSN